MNKILDLVAIGTVGYVMPSLAMLGAVTLFGWPGLSLILVVYWAGNRIYKMGPSSGSTDKAI